MDPQLLGYLLYFVSLMTQGGIFALLVLGLNVQWGFAGLFNVGVAGFFAIGAYTTAILITGADESHWGGFQFTFFDAMLISMVMSGILAYLVAKLCLKLRSDYLAIATIGIAEIIRLFFKNEVDITNGPRGISNIPKPFSELNLPDPLPQMAFMAMVLLAVLCVYLLLEILRKSPWGRVMTAIRENEPAVRAAGKNVEKFRVEGFVLGAMLMGLAGAFIAPYLRFIDPQVSDPLTSTFLIWVMLIVGGSANNKGAVLGAFLMWFIWSGTEIIIIKTVSGFDLPVEYAVRGAYVRIFLIGLTLQVFLQKFPLGILPENRPKPMRKSSS